MPLTAQEAFKVGYLAKCAEDGLTAEQTAESCRRAAEVLQKRAFLGPIGDLAGRGADAVGSALGGVAHYGIPAALIAPPLLGAAAGYGLAKATDIDDADVEDIKRREIINELRRQSDKLRTQTSARDYTQSVRRTGRPFM